MEIGVTLSTSMSIKGLPCGSANKESSCYAEDPSSTPGLGRFLEKEMATHASILAEKILWIEEPDGLQFRGSQELDMT